MKHALIANGRRITCHVNGRARTLPLVLLHGFCEDHTVWNPLLPLLKGLRVVRVDLPGFGGSDLPVAPGMDAYADAVCAVLNDLGIARCVLVGHSMGGYTALAFARKYAERLAGWGLFHAHPFADSAEQRGNRQRGIETLRSGKKDLYVAQLFPNLFAPAFAEKHPEIIQTLVRRGRRQPTEGIIAALEGMMARSDHSSTLQEAAAPVLLLSGEKDKLVTEEQRRQMAPMPRIADLHLMTGVAHMAMFEAPEKSADILRYFQTLCLKFN